MPLPGFHTETFELNELEKSLIPIFIIGLKDKKGRANAITSTEMIDKLEQKKGIKITGSRVRKIIQYIRAKKLLDGLVASNSGYYISFSPHELQRYLKSLKGRRNDLLVDIQYIEDCLKEVLRLKQQSMEFEVSK